MSTIRLPKLYGSNRSIIRKKNDNVNAVVFYDDINNNHHNHNNSNSNSNNSSSNNSSSSKRGDEMNSSRSLMSPTSNNSENFSESFKSPSKRTRRSNLSRTYTASKAMIQHLAVSCCLRPHYSLRRQLLSTFGILSIGSLAIILLATLLTSRLTGIALHNTAEVALEEWSRQRVTSYAKNFAEILHVQGSLVWGVLRTLRELTQERLRGYPNAEGYLNDSLTPFYSTLNNRSVYPLQPVDGLLLPLDVDAVGHVNKDNAAQHLQQHRVDWYQGVVNLSTATANVFLQGSCSTIDNASCIPSLHNNVTTGGSYNPTSTFATLYERVSDYATPTMKSLYETYKDMQMMGLYLANDGAGMSVTFPTFYRNTSSTYTSVGCDWLLEPNPYFRSRPELNKTIGTREQAAKCHPAGTTVSYRYFNPLETGWCRKFARNPFFIQNYGPYRNPFTNDMMLGFGEGVYDTLTYEFIGCMFVELLTERISKVLQGMEYVETGRVTSVRWESEEQIQDGTVLFSYPGGDASRILNVSEVSVPYEVYRQMQRDWEQSYRPDNLQPETSLYRVDHRLYSYYPIPLPPKDQYLPIPPHQIIITSIDESVIQKSVDQLDSAVRTSVRFLIRDILFGELLGMLVVLLVVYLVSLSLTLPLRWMRETGESIVAAVGSRHEHLQDNKLPWIYKYTPRSEVSRLVEEFLQLTQRFAGSGTAKLYKRQMLEVKNPFALHDNFQALYQLRDDDGFPYNFMRDAKEETHHQSKRELFSGYRRSWGPNVRSSGTDGLLDRSLLQINGEEMDYNSDDDNGKKCFHHWKSPLFRTIVLCIVVPLLLAMMFIAGNGVVRILNAFPPLISRLEADYKELELKNLIPSARLRGFYASVVTAIAYRDLHVLARFLSWTYFGAISVKNESLTSMVTAAEVCKHFPRDECPFVRDSAISTCDCAWNDPWGFPCQNYAPGKSRALQRLYFSGQSQDVYWPIGTRNLSSYPHVAYLPNATDFWPDLESVPGANLTSVPLEKTTFDRLRVAAASSVVQVPLYNYVINGPSTHRNWAVYVGFEEDGTLIGYAGCDQEHAYHAYFRSNKENGAGFLNPELCPFGKYGYDPRCRDWYVTGKATALKGEDPLYMTPPYEFVSTLTTAASATLPIMNDKTGEYVGQALTDFSPSDIINILSQEETPLSEGGFHVLITAKKDANGHNTVVGPDFDFEKDSSSIVDVLLPYDECDESLDSSTVSCVRRSQLAAIVDRMANGDFTPEITNFTRSTSEGTSEVVHFAFAPVEVISFRFLDPTSLAAGFQEYNSTVYSLALGETDDGIAESYEKYRKSMHQTLHLAGGVLVGVLLLLIAIVFYVTSIVSSSISVPISKLLSIVRDINRNSVDIDDDELPDIRGGSLEIARVRETFSRLFMCVRFGTTAFYAGDLGGAYETFLGALTLFTKLKNEKAIAIANNDLGNIMLTIYRVMKATSSPPSIYGMTKQEIIEKGCKYFERAIELGEEALARINENEGWSTNYLIFMQQLSNRYFNRALFLLTVRDDHPNPDEAERLGRMDLSTSKDMDREVVDNGDQEGFKGEMDVYFELLMGRIRGILALVKLGFEDEWGLDDLLEEARKSLTKALRIPGHALFRHMEPAGQMQRLDHTLMEYYGLEESRDLVMASKIAIRMLMEDDYVIGESATVALKTLIDSIVAANPDDFQGMDRSDVQSTLFNYRHTIVETMSLQFSKKDGLRRASYVASNAGDFSMEYF